MAIVSVNEIWDRSSSEDADRLVEFVRTWRVITNDPLDDAKIVRNAPGTPAIGQPYVTATSMALGSKVVKKEATQDQDDPYTWLVKASYSNKKKDVPENPLDRPPIIRFSAEKYKKPLEQDRDGNAIVNSSGEAFDPPIEKDAHRVVMHYRYNRLDFDPHVFYPFMNTVNDAAFFNFGAGEVKCSNIQAEEKTEGDDTVTFNFWEVSLEFQINEEFWHAKPLDQGYGTIDGNGDYHIIEDTNGQPLNRPTLLDGFGDVLDLTSDDPVFLDFLIYEEKNFDTLITP